MNMHARTTNGSAAHIPLFNPLGSRDQFWWGYPSFAKALIDTQKALLNTQKAAVSYVEANTKLMDEIRDILEFNLSLQMSRKMLEGVSETNRPAIPALSDINGSFDSAIASWRELGEAWMNAQLRSLDALRVQPPSGYRRHSRQRPTTTD